MEYSSIILVLSIFLFYHFHKIIKFFNIQLFFYLTFSRFETYDTNVHSPSEFGKTVRIAATSILNINVSAANLETFVGSILSWRRQLDLEQKAKKINEVIQSLHVASITFHIYVYIYIIFFSFSLLVGVQ